MFESLSLVCCSYTIIVDKANPLNYDVIDTSCMEIVQTGNGVNV